MDDKQYPKTGIYSEGTLRTTIVRDRDGQAIHATRVRWRSGRHPQGEITLAYLPIEVVIDRNFTRAYMWEVNSGCREVQLEHYPTRLTSTGDGYSGLLDDEGRLAYNVTSIEWGIDGEGDGKGYCIIHFDGSYQPHSDFDHDKHFIIREDRSLSGERQESE